MVRWQLGMGNAAAALDLRSKTADVQAGDQ